MVPLLNLKVPDFSLIDSLTALCMNPRTKLDLPDPEIPQQTDKHPIGKSILIFLRFLKFTFLSPIQFEFLAFLERGGKSLHFPSMGCEIPSLIYLAVGEYLILCSSVGFPNPTTLPPSLPACGPISMR